MKVRKNILLAPYTTFRIGGPAEFLVETETVSHLIEAVSWGRKKGLAITILGGGSNVLVSDQGIKGLVIINRASSYQVVGRGGKARVKVASGTNLFWLINRLLAEEITGLHWFAGIPGTIGGAVYNNIHASGLLLEEFVYQVEILDEKERRRLLTKKECQFGYDYSRFQKTKEIILTADFILRRGAVDKAKTFVKEEIKLRQKYPLFSAGCIFKNLDEKTQKKLKLDSPSWGYLIDKVLGLKGKQIGGAKISEKHANFIVNQSGQAKAIDVLALIELIKKKSQKKLGIKPELEIFLLGFGQ